MTQSNIVIHKETEVLLSNNNGFENAYSTKLETKIGSGEFKKQQYLWNLPDLTIRTKIKIHNLWETFIFTQRPEKKFERI